MNKKKEKEQNKTQKKKNCCQKFEQFVVTKKDKRNFKQINEKKKIK